MSRHRVLNIAILLCFTISFQPVCMAADTLTQQLELRDREQRLKLKTQQRQYRSLQKGLSASERQTLEQQHYRQQQRQLNLHHDQRRRALTLKSLPTSSSKNRQSIELQRIMRERQAQQLEFKMQQRTWQQRFER